MKTSSSYTISKIYDGDKLFTKWGTSTSNTTIPTSYIDIEPSPAANIFIWRKEGHGLTEDSATWGNPVCMTGSTGDKGTKGEQGIQGPKGETGEKGIDGDKGVLTLSFYEQTLSLQGNGQTSGYIIYNNTKFYINESFKCSVGGDGIIIVDISQSIVSALFKKMILNDDNELAFVDFNTSLNPITKDMVDSNWQYVMIGEFSCSTSGVILNASLKPVISLMLFLSDQFTSILRNNSSTTEDLEKWAKAIGCDEYYNALAVSTLFAGKIFSKEIILTEEGNIRSSNFDTTALTGFRMTSEGILDANQLNANGATITGNTVLSGNAIIDLGDSEDSLLKTQYGTDGTGSTNFGTGIRWLGKDAINSVSVGSKSSASYNNNSTTFTKYFRGDGATGNLPIKKASFSSGGDATSTFIAPFTGTYKFNISVSGGMMIFGTAIIKVDGTELYNDYGVLTVSYTIQAGSSVSIHVEANKDDGYIKAAFYGNGLFLYNGSDYNISEIMQINSSGAYSNRLILGSIFDSNNYKNLKTMDTLASGIDINKIYPTKNTSIFSIDGESYVAKFIAKTTNYLNITTTNGLSKSFLLNYSTSEPSTKGWYDASGTIYFAGETRGLLTGSLLPVSTNNDIGDVLNRYKTAFVDVLNANTVTGMFGQGQSWHNVASTRTVDTNHHNDTDKPIYVSVVLTGTDEGAQVYGYLVIDSKYTVQQFELNASSSTSAELSLCAIIPSGSYYKVHMGGGDTVKYWYEYK